MGIKCLDSSRIVVKNESIHLTTRKGDHRDRINFLYWAGGGTQAEIREAISSHRHRIYVWTKIYS